MTHPFHPWHGREFVLLSVRQTWSQDRVFFLDEDGCQYSLPVGWTDAVEPDVFVTAAAGRSPFRFADLAELAVLIDGLRVSDTSDGCKADSAAAVNAITPQCCSDKSSYAAIVARNSTDSACCT